MITKSTSQSDSTTPLTQLDDNTDLNLSDNFAFYLFASNYGRTNNEDYSDGPSTYAQLLLKDFPTIAEAIAKSRGFVTAFLNVPSDKDGNHTAFLGLSSNLVIEIQFSNQSFDNVMNASLLQAENNAPGWNGGIISFAYVDGFLFAGMGDRIITTKEEFQWKHFLTSLWDMNPDFNWIHKKDHIGGAVNVYNFQKQNWQHCIDGTREKAAVKSMKAFNFNDRTFALTFASQGELPQTISKGFNIKTKTIGDAPIAYALPTASKVTVSRLQYTNEGVQLAIYNPDFEYWSHINLFPTFWKEPPYQVIVGESDERILYAIFSNGDIKTLNLDNIGDENKGWSKLTTINKNTSSSLLLNPYSQTTPLLIARENGNIDSLDINNTSLTTVAEFNSEVKFMDITSIDSDHFIAYLCKDNSIHIQKNQNPAVQLQTSGSTFNSIALNNSKVEQVDPTVLSNLLVTDDNKIIFYAGYCTGDIKQCIVNSSDLSDSTCQFIRSYANGLPLAEEGSSPGYVHSHKYGTYNFYTPKGDSQSIGYYASDIQAKLANGKVELLAQISQLTYKKYESDYIETTGLGSYTSQFDPSNSPDEVFWSKFANNINENT